MMFSIIIPAYNAEKYIKRSIDSVLLQENQNFEIIVVNDGSTDNTADLVKRIEDNRVILLEQDNAGVSAARNAGIKQAKGEYICFLDADDEYLPNHLRTLNNMIMEYPKCSFFSTRFCVELLSGEVKNPKVDGSIQFYKDAVVQTLHHTEFIWTGCVCVKRECFDLFGGFEVGVKLAEDIDMWRRIFVHTGVVYGNIITVKRNRDGSEATRSYVRRYEVDPLNRLQGFLQDHTISNEIKESLKTENEWLKLSVARSYIIDGDKRNARKTIKSVNKSSVPFSRYLITVICLWVPTKVIRMVISKNNKGMYKEKDHVRIS